MSLIPYIFDERPFRMVNRNSYRPDIFQPFQQIVPRDYFNPLEDVFRPLENVYRQLEQVSSAMNNLALQESSKISSDGEKFQVNIDVQHFAPDEINVKVVDGFVTIEAKHEEKKDQHGYIARQFVRRYALPQGCLPDTVESKLSSDGVLTITAPKVLALPSSGERIVPITQTGPVKKQISSELVEK